MKNGLVLIAALGLAGCASGITPPPLPSRGAKRVAVNHAIPPELRGRIIVASYGIPRLDSARNLNAKAEGFSSASERLAADEGVISPQSLTALLHHPKSGVKPAVKAKPTAKKPAAKVAPPKAKPAIQKIPLPPKPVKPPAPPLPHWQLDAGRLVGRQLSAWASRSGWTVQWNLNQDWSVPVSTQYKGDFVTVAGNVVKALAADGLNIRAKFYEGNHVLVVSGGK